MSVAIFDRPIGPKRRDYRDEHEGCTAMGPWLPGCSRYRRVEGPIASVQSLALEVLWYGARIPGA